MVPVLVLDSRRITSGIIPLLGVRHSMVARSERPSAEDLRIPRVVRATLSRIPQRVVLEFVRQHPEASVFMFCQTHLAGLYPRAAGVTRVAYNSIYGRLATARRKLGFAPPTRKGLHP